MDISNLANNTNANPAPASTQTQAPVLSDEQTVKETLAFLNADILKLMGAENMPAEQKDRIYQKMMDTIQNRVLLQLVDSLSEEQYQEFKQIIEKNDEEEFAVFAQKAGINLSQLYAEEALLYKIEMVNLIKSSTATGDDKSIDGK